MIAPTLALLAGKEQNRIRRPPGTADISRLEAASTCSRAHLAAGAVWAALFLLAAGPAMFGALAAPTASFTYSPGNPVVGERVVFTSTSSDPDDEIEDYDWDLDGDGDFDDGDDPTESIRYTHGRRQDARLRIAYEDEDDDEEEVTVQRTVTVRGQRGTHRVLHRERHHARHGPGGELTSTSSDPEGRLVDQRWDLDNDGRFDDAFGSTASVTFTRNETRRVTLQVTDSVGVVRTTFQDLVVQNRRPTASFTTSAHEVDTGTAITFTSTAVDPDGSIAAPDRRWDFNGDGVTDATGVTVTRSFADNGTPTITHSVTDDDGGIGASSQPGHDPQPSPDGGLRRERHDRGHGHPDHVHLDLDATPTARWSPTRGTSTATAPPMPPAPRSPTASTTTGPPRSPCGSPTTTTAPTPWRATVTIRNRAPTAAFTVSPDSPVAGDPVQLSSTAADSDGTVAEQRWDLDGDGAYDDATGPQVSTVFAEVGPHTVGLEVTDDDLAVGAPPRARSKWWNVRPRRHRLKEAEAEVPPSSRPWPSRRPL